MNEPKITAVVVAFGNEPVLEQCIRSLLASHGAEVDVVVVDNGCTDDGVSTVSKLPRVSTIDPGSNVGFAQGCNLGAAGCTGDFVALINPDAVVAPDALLHLAAVAGEANVGIASASLRLADTPTLMNSAGNEVHFLGFSWCGALGLPATEFASPRDVTAASGAAMMLRRAAWEDLGGFAPEYFAYHEDSELSLRCWQRGHRVAYVPDAVVTHRYEFARHHQKMYLVERNRLLGLLTLLEGRTLALLAPVLIAVDLAILVVALTEGWGRDKARGWWWLWRNRRWIRRRREQLQLERVRSDRALANRFATRLAEGNQPLSPTLRVLDAGLAAYWWLARRLLAG